MERGVGPRSHSTGVNWAVGKKITRIKHIEDVFKIFTIYIFFSSQYPYAVDTDDTEDVTFDAKIAKL